MSWPDILRELVGYIRFAEALVPDAQKPGKSVLEEIRDYCTAERMRLQHDLDMNSWTKHDAMIDMANGALNRIPRHKIVHMLGLLSQMKELAH
jgi:hypothetical protein